MRFEHLTFPPQWKDYWTKYPHGMTILESLIDWATKTNDLTDNVNNWNAYLNDFVATFDDNLKQEVTETVQSWIASGYIEVVISAALQTQIDDVELQLNNEVQRIDAQLADLSTNIVQISDDFSNYAQNKQTKKPLPRPEAFYDNFLYRIPGAISGQGDYLLGTITEGYYANIVNNTLEISSPYNTTRGLIINRDFNEGTIRMLVKASTNPIYMLMFRQDSNLNSKYAIWSSNGSSLEFGWILGEVITSKMNSIIPPSGVDYYVEVKCPTIYIGSEIEIRIWSTAGSRPSTPTGTYTIAVGDQILAGKDVSIQTIGVTVTKIGEIYIAKGLNNINLPLSQAYYSGRWTPQIVNGKDVMTTINQGSEIYLEIENTDTLIAEFVLNSVTAPFIAYSIDGGDYIRAEVTSLITLANNLSTGKHLVKIVASGIQEDDEVWTKGKGLCLLGFTVTWGGSIKPYVPDNKPILFIGDSITAGVNVLGTGATSQNNSGEKAFPQVCSKILGAIPIQVGFGSTGAVVSGSGGVPNAQIYTDLMMSDKQENTEFPSAVVVTHGTNDRWQTSVDFTAGYGNLIDIIKNKYPNTPIFCVRPFPLGSMAAEIQSVANTKGCYYVDTTSWTVTTTDGVHPDVNGHLVAGTKLAEFIESTLGKYYFL